MKKKPTKMAKNLVASGRWCIWLIYKRNAGAASNPSSPGETSTKCGGLPTTRSHCSDAGMPSRLSE
jgi:hypothetical protein